MKETIEFALKVTIFPKKFWLEVFHRKIPKSFILKYVLTLALIGPVLSLFSMTVIEGITFKKSIFYSITTYIMDIISVYIYAVIIRLLDKEVDLQSSLKISAFGSTPVWLSDIVDIYQPLRPLSTLGLLYSLYIIYMAIKLKSPKGYRVVGLLLFVFIVLYVVNSLIAESIVQNPIVRQVIV